MASLNPRSATRAELRQLAGLARARERRAVAECLVEGATLLGEALDAGLVPRLVAASPDLAEEHQALLRRAAEAGAEVLSAPAESLARAADREHGPALLAALPQAPPGRLDTLPAEGPALALALCGLQDPGNVGTLLRSARAFGASLCLTLPGTADVCGPKVIRASAGAVFSLPCLQIEGLAELLAAVELTAVAAVAPGAGAGVGTGAEAAASGGAGSELGEARSAAGSEGAEAIGGGSPAARSLPRRCLLLLGHETRGIDSPAGLERVSVPQQAGVDSLNVAMAGSILMAGWYGEQRG